MAIEVRLRRLVARPVTLHFSPGYEERARALGALVAEAHQFLAAWLGVEIPITLSVLRHENWRRLRRAPYGYPHSSPEQATIFAPATYPPRLIERTRALVEAAPAALREPLGMSDAELRVQIVAFYDLVAVHELGHLFIHHLQLALGTRWLTELVANLFATAFFVEARPDLAPGWLAWAALQRSLDVAHRSLDEYEQHYHALDFANAAFYQGRFNGLALDLWQRQGRALAPALAAEFGLRPDAVAHRFARVAPGWVWE